MTHHRHTTPAALALLRPGRPPAPERYPLWRRALGLAGPTLAVLVFLAALLAWWIALSGGPGR